MTTPPPDPQTAQTHAESTPEPTPEPTPDLVAPGVYDGHDDLSEHMPWTRETIARYYRIKAWYERFSRDAAHYRENACPPECHPLLWKTLGAAAQEQAADLARQMSEMRLHGLIPEDLR